MKNKIENIKLKIENKFVLRFKGLPVKGLHIIYYFESSILYSLFSIFNLLQSSIYNSIFVFLNFQFSIFNLISGSRQRENIITPTPMTTLGSSATTYSNTL